MFSFNKYIDHLRKIKPSCHAEPVDAWWVSLCAPFFDKLRMTPGALFALYFWLLAFSFLAFAHKPGRTTGCSSFAAFAHLGSASAKPERPRLPHRAYMFCRVFAEADLPTEDRVSCGLKVASCGLFWL